MKSTAIVSIPQENIFVHYNTSLLFSGDYLYYKIYTLNSQTNKFTTDYLEEDFAIRMPATKFAPLKQLENLLLSLPKLQPLLKKLSPQLKPLTRSLKINQKGGFDCPGCAWPDPDDDRSRLGEYCENGIKALAEEATKRKANPEFFAQHSIDELAKMTEFELGKSGRITHPMILEEGASYYKPINWNDALYKRITYALCEY